VSVLENRFHLHLAPRAGGKQSNLSTIKHHVYHPSDDFITVY
jgi:hypothetical protein